MFFLQPYGCFMVFHVFFMFFLMVFLWFFMVPSFVSALSRWPVWGTIMELEFRAPRTAQTALMSPCLSLGVPIFQWIALGGSHSTHALRSLQGVDISVDHGLAHLSVWLLSQQSN